MIDPGNYNKRITFCRLEKAEKGDFEKLRQTDAPVRTAWASVRATGGTESYEEQRLNNTITYDVRTRFSPLLMDPTLIIRYAGRRFEIRSVVDVREEHKELAFTCVEILKTGERRRERRFSF